ncbi:hypothetical protein [uncultured Desulfovibrio sp.]|nr:hypothetical protein [uncultured Desulfovibrio sp.]CAI3222414.1 hypothetical protein DWUX_459 [Desulfovibrio diazotrophicus]
MINDTKILTSMTLEELWRRFPIVLGQFNVELPWRLRTQLPAVEA